MPIDPVQPSSPPPPAYRATGSVREAILDATRGPGRADRRIEDARADRQIEEIARARFETKDYWAALATENVRNPKPTPILYAEALKQQNREFVIAQAMTDRAARTTEPRSKRGTSIDTVRDLRPKAARLGVELGEIPQAQQTKLTEKVRKAYQLTVYAPEGRLIDRTI